MLRTIATKAIVMAGLVCAICTRAETPTIDPSKAAQLHRLEPLNDDKIDVFVQSGQLSRAQADYVRRHIGPKGTLELPEGAVAPEAPRRIVRDDPPPAVQQPGSPYAGFGYKLSDADRDRVRKLLRDFRNGDRNDIVRELRKYMPDAFELFVDAYKDPIDLPVKIALWSEFANHTRRDAVIGLFETHRIAYEVAKPVLVPYEKDVGGVLVRRKRTTLEDGPPEHFYTSRDLREMILDIEGLISRCSGPNAAIFLMEVYGQRYGNNDAPMRDSHRDRHRLVQACGGNEKKFDQDERETWKSVLSAHERAIIAERLIPYLSKPNNDRRKIAKNGLMICLPHKHPDWDAGAEEWERWWDAHKNELMAEK
jgi:hypothetical protein